MRIATACLTLVLAASISACIEPADRRPGLRLTGKVVSGPVDDWSFTADHREIFIETRTWYFVPHSVTIVCADADGELFVGAREPETKRWVANVARDPEVRLKIGERIYEGRLERLESDEELERVRTAYLRKLGRPMESNAADAPPNVWYWRVAARTP